MSCPVAKAGHLYHVDASDFDTSDYIIMGCFLTIVLLAFYGAIKGISDVNRLFFCSTNTATAEMMWTARRVSSNCVFANSQMFLYASSVAASFCVHFFA